MADNLSARDNAIVYLAAQGKANSEIAEALGISAYLVTKALSLEPIQFEVRRLQHKLFGSDAKATKARFTEMLPKAMESMEEIIDNPSAKPGLRLKAAQEVFDRALGKPTQTVHVEGSLIKDVYDRLDNLRGSDLGIIDVTPRAPEALEPGQEPTSQAVHKDEIDSWIDQNL